MIRYILNFKRFFFFKKAGFFSIFTIALPLVLSSTSYTVMQFINRKFLFWYGSDDFAASTPSAMLAFTFLSLFLGITNYLNVFVAQYFGAKEEKRVGDTLWQGIFFALFCWPFITLLIFFADDIFTLAGHVGKIKELEIISFKIFIFGSIFLLLNSVFSAFFSGLGKTKVVFFVRAFEMLVNVPLCYYMIFDKECLFLGGIQGASIATVSASALATICFLCFLIFTKVRKQFYIFSSCRFDIELFLRILKFGTPNGVQFFVDIFAMSFFLLMIGRLSAVELEASNVAWSMNSLIFMPMVGLAIALSTISGQAIGQRRLYIAHIATLNTFVIMIFCMSIIGFIFVVFPEQALWLLFSGREDIISYEMVELSKLFLKFVAFYSAFDALALVFSATIKSAGDTKFVMWVTLFNSIVFLVIPSYLICAVFKLSAVYSWVMMSIYIMAMATLFVCRYINGSWKRMRVIEKQVC